MKMEHRNSQSRSMKRRQVALARRFVGLLPAALVAVPAGAQDRDTVVVTRAVSTWQTDVDRLRQDLLSQQRLESQLFRMLAEVEMKRRAAVPDSQPKFMAQSQMLFARMREASQEQNAIKRRLETLCEAVRKPTGWLGVVTTGFQMEDKRPDGTKIVRFLEPPVVATVDPGSPAERVGVRAGDVLVEIGGQRVLRGNIVFADMLRPGREIVMKLQRGNEIITLTPTVDPLPQGSSTTSCSFVDLAVDYIVAPKPAQAPRIMRVESGVQGEGNAYTYTYEPSRVKGTAMVRARKDTSTDPGRVPVAAAGGVAAGPMVNFFGVGTNVLAGVQLMGLSSESSRLVGVSHGILVNSVLPGTPGHESGLRGGDILLMADSVNLSSVVQLQRIIRGSADQVVRLVIMRDKKRETIQLRW